MNRRNFLSSVSLGVIGCSLGTSMVPAAARLSSNRRGSAVALVKGDSRLDNMYRAIQLIGGEVKQKIGEKQVIIKPNMISFTEEFAATYKDHLRAILEFLKPFYKKKVIIAESSPRGPSMKGYRQLGYLELEKDYDIEWMDLNTVESYQVFILNDSIRPNRITIPKILVDPNTFLISAARLKVHNSVIVTLSNKNITMGAPQIIGKIHHKRAMHQGKAKGINYNIFRMTQTVPIHLATIDGYEGMERKGPRGGDPVNSRIAIASTDFLAADRVAVECMGINFDDIGYLNYCANAGMGEVDLKKITIKGERIANCRKTYRLPENINEQLMWKS